MRLFEYFSKKLVHWLMKERMPYKTKGHLPLSDFERIRYEIKPCDILLIEGHSRVSDVIRLVTQSPWTHSVLCIGKIQDIEDPIIKDKIRKNYAGSENEQLVIESLLGKGTIVSPLERYRHTHIRICRPDGIARNDIQQVISFAAAKLGAPYNIRHILDLARLLIPWSFLPRRWRSSLFRLNAKDATKQICSSLLAEAFNNVKFPILPARKLSETDTISLFERNPRLFTPKDFDYSPFFKIIKYPIYDLATPALYRQLPWIEDNIVMNDDGSTLTQKEPTNEEKNDGSAS